MSKLTVHLPNRPKGEPIEVFPFGLVKNGESIEVESLEEDTVVGDTSVDLPEYEFEDLSKVEDQNFQDPSERQAVDAQTGQPVASGESEFGDVSDEGDLTEPEPPVKGEDMVAPPKATRVKKETS